jgi:hypothetical protein
MKSQFDFKYIVDPSQMIDLRIAVESLISKLEFDIKYHKKAEDSYPVKYKKELEQLLSDIDFDKLKTIYKPD